MKKRYIALILCICFISAAFAGCKLEQQDQFSQAPQVISPEVTINQSEKEEANVIEVSGSGEVVLAPDMATVNIQVRTDNEDAAAAQKENTEIMDSVIAAIKAAGVKESDIATSNVSLDEQYDYDKSPAEVVGYRMTNTIKVTIRSIDSVGKVVSDAISAGATGTYGLSLSVSDSSMAYQQALKAAVSDAKNKADAIAEALGVSLENIPASVLEQTSDYSAMRAYSLMDLNEAVVEDSEVSISAGELTVSAKVTVTYKIEG